MLDVFTGLLKKFGTKSGKFQAKDHPASHSRRESKQDQSPPPSKPKLFINTLGIVFDVAKCVDQLHNVAVLNQLGQRLLQLRRQAVRRIRNKPKRLTIPPTGRPHTKKQSIHAPAIFCNGERPDFLKTDSDKVFTFFGRNFVNLRISNLINPELDDLIINLPRRFLRAGETYRSKIIPVEIIDVHEIRFFVKIVSICKIHKMRKLEKIAPVNYSGAETSIRAY
ncbi:MAG: hypothetical protein FWC50_06885 [Planctomycetaceae bacterium]|nr:hypothetical protein [Planctomycetaceae bacterium]